MAFELIEASAGTGKTHAITSRYILLLIEAGLQVDQILVLTFTEAATAELRDRLRTRIRQVRNAIASDTLEKLEDRDLLTALRPACATQDSRIQAEKRLTTALVAFDEAAVFTIHGFCRRILTEKAFSSGMDFSAEVVTDDLPILESVVADFGRSSLSTLSKEEYASCVEHGLFFDGARSSDWKASGRVMTPERLTSLRDIISNPFVRLVPSAPPLGTGTTETPPQAVAFRVMHDLIAFVRDTFAQRKREQGVQSFNDMLMHVRAALTEEGGDRLAVELRSTFRAALIDEFQDTDPLQYDIVRRIYEGSECPVVFVGDPKQAIYSFRGGDVFAYFQATAKIPKTRIRTLSTNYRSARDLVAAIDGIFTYGNQTFPFADGGRTAFPQVSAHHPEGKEPLRLPLLQNRSAFHWFLLPEAPPKSAQRYGWAKSDAQRHALRAVVDEIRLLVPRGLKAKGELTHGDIAVLVRTNDQADVVREVLHSAGIPCIVRAQGSVFSSASAVDLLAILRAVLSPGNDALLSTALVTPTLGHTAHDVIAIKNDAARYGAIADRLLALRTRWEDPRNGFMHMATDLLYGPGLAAGGASIATSVLRYADAERRLTDLLHLVELLHQESILRPGQEHLLRWLEQQRGARSEQSEEASIRLESDARRVQIVTVHSSKGLEYPVVFCPFTWEGIEVRRSTGSVVFCHDLERDAETTPDGIPALIADLGSPAYEEHFQMMAKEKRSEAIRHLYVALTRARQRCYAVWGPANRMENAALTWLFFPECKGESAQIKKLSYDKITEPILHLTRTLGGAVSTSVLESSLTGAPATAGATGLELPAPGPAREFARGPLTPVWSFTSYTSLTSDWIRSGKDVDAGVERSAAEPTGDWSIFSFPAGARTGTLLHRLFELLDFQSPGDVRDQLVRKLLMLNAYPAEFAPAVANMVTTVLRTPLGPAGMRLENLETSACVKELDFVYTVDRLRINRLRAVMQDPRSGLPPAFAEAAGRLRDRDVHGFMIGTIDLLAHHDGRFYLLDYKSNHLGNRPEEYAPPALLGVMAREQYYLQALIYTIAVHRYLRQRVPGYSYDTHFGGVLYLFLRGMSDQGDGGIYIDRPHGGLVAAIEECLQEGGRT